MGFEPTNDGFAIRSPDSVSHSATSSCEHNAEALTGPLAETIRNDADLRAVVDAWPTLPDAVKVGILAMVRASRS